MPDWQTLRITGPVKVDTSRHLYLCMWCLRSSKYQCTLFCSLNTSTSYDPSSGYMSCKMFFLLTHLIWWKHYTVWHIHDAKAHFQLEDTRKYFQLFYFCTSLASTSKYMPCWQSICFKNKTLFISIIYFCSFCIESTIGEKLDYLKLVYVGKECCTYFLPPYKNQYSTKHD